MVRVKICGITNPDDAALAVDLGADALGFIFAPSPRRVSPLLARAIISGLPPFVTTVGVFVNEHPETIRQVHRTCGLDFVQFHGDEPPDLCMEWMPRIIKAFRMKDRSTLREIEPYRKGTRAVLLDAHSTGARGGTGKVFDWDLALEAKAAGFPTILSGGLNPSNVEEAIRRVEPFAVDVNSGVEGSPGRKDPVLLERFMETVNRINRELIPNAGLRPQPN
ncbi:MAG: phosphoribosylanthranilate isomerase [Thermodesulfobacteriota bacterium]